jgi:hypothetical protein
MTCRLAIVAALALTAGCTELGEQPFTAAPDSSSNDANGTDASGAPPTLDALHDEVFSSCSCHLASAPAAELDLARGVIHAQLVDRVSSCNAADVLVVPGSPGDSLLVQKLAVRTEGADGVCGSGMPLIGAAISQSSLDGIRRWILDGALDTP